MASNKSDLVLQWFESTSIITAGVIGVVLTALRFIPKRKHDEDKKYIEVHGEIHETLTELRVKTDAARSQIIQFHNGEYFMDGVSMRKFTLTHESLSRGMSADAGRIKGLLCSMFVPLLNAVVADDPKIISMYDLQHSFFKQFFEDNNVEGFCVLPIRIRNQITGFLLNQWCNSTKFDMVDTSVVKESMLYARNAIEVQLASQKKG
jgi:hypothetical protein